MKKLKLIFGAFIILFALQSNAQVSVSLNIGSRPDWCHEYHDDVEYVYFPEIECYYDMHAGIYLYFGPHGWIRSQYLPEYCHGYDINRGHRVVIDYRGRAPYTYFDNHRRMYYRDNYRNYRQEYYHRNYNRRSNYVAMNDRRDYGRNDDRSNYYKKENHDRGNGHGNGNGPGNGNGRGHGRR